MPRGKIKTKNTSTSSAQAKKATAKKSPAKKTTKKKAEARSKKGKKKKSTVRRTTKKKTPAKKIVIKEAVQEVEESDYPEDQDVLNTYQKQEEQKDRTLLMWAGVTFFMVLIGFVWIMNTKRVFQETKLSAPESDVNWSELGEGISDTWGTLKQELGEIKKMNQASSTDDQASTLLDTEVATSTQKSGELSAEEFEELKQKLKEIEDKLNTTNEE